MYKLQFFTFIFDVLLPGLSRLLILSLAGDIDPVTVIYIYGYIRQMATLDATNIVTDNKSN